MSRRIRSASGGDVGRPDTGATPRLGPDRPRRLSDASGGVSKHGIHVRGFPNASAAPSDAN